MTFEKITKQKVLDAIPKTKKGLEKYLNIQQMLKDGVSVRDENFQRAFNSFYKVRGRSSEWHDHFYSVFLETTIKNLSFERILNDIYVKTGRVEASFSSKIRASVDENSAVIDKYVLENLDLKLPRFGDPNRLIKINNLYDFVNKEMKILSEAKIGKFILNEFFNFHKKCDVSPIKALDLTIWQIRME